MAGIQDLMARNMYYRNRPMRYPTVGMQRPPMGGGIGGLPIPPHILPSMQARQMGPTGPVMPPDQRHRMMAMALLRQQSMRNQMQQNTPYSIGYNPQAQMPGGAPSPVPGPSPMTPNVGYAPVSPSPGPMAPRNVGYAPPAPSPGPFNPFGGRTNGGGFADMPPNVGYSPAGGMGTSGRF